MRKPTDTPRGPAIHDAVLEELWRVKKELSAKYGHDLEKMVEATRENEKKSGHPFADLPSKAPRLAKKS